MFLPVHSFVTVYRIEVQFRSLKPATCESCGCEYLHEIDRHATATVSSPFDLLTTRYVNKLLEARSERLLAKRLERPDIVACPRCGWFQADMVRQMRWRWFGKGLLVTLLLTTVVGVAMIALGTFDLPVPALASGVTFAVGLAVAAWRAIRDPDQRRFRGGTEGPRQPKPRLDDRGTAPPRAAGRSSAQRRMKRHLRPCLPAVMPTWARRTTDSILPMRRATSRFRSWNWDLRRRRRAASGGKEKKVRGGAGCGKST